MLTHLGALLALLGLPFRSFSIVFWFLIFNPNRFFRLRSRSQRMVCFGRFLDAFWLTLGCCWPFWGCHLAPLAMFLWFLNFNPNRFSGSNSRNQRMTYLSIFVGPFWVTLGVVGLLGCGSWRPWHCFFGFWILNRTVFSD